MTKIAFAIRPLTSSDAPSVGPLHVETWLDTYRGLIPDEQLDRLDPLRRAEQASQWLQDLRDGMCHLGAFAGEELLGFASAGRPREAWGYDSELWAINIPRRFQGHGVGRALMREAVAYCRQQAARNMYLYCIIGNDNALNFYRHLGAKESKRMKEADGYREVALVWDDLSAATF